MQDSTTHSGFGKWLVGLATSALMGVGGATVTTTVSHGSRIAVLETQAVGQQQQLDRIERKLDRALSHDRAGRGE